MEDMLAKAKSCVVDQKLEPRQIPLAVEILRTSTEDMPRLILIRQLIRETNKDTLKRFVKNEGMVVLAELLRAEVDGTLRDPPFTKLVLDVIPNLPLTVSDLMQSEGGKQVKRLRKAEQEEVRAAAVRVYDFMEKLVLDARSGGAAPQAPAPPAAASQPPAKKPTSAPSAPLVPQAPSGSSAAASAEPTKKARTEPPPKPTSEPVFGDFFSSSSSTSQVPKRKPIAPPPKPIARTKIISAEADGTKASDKKEKILRGSVGEKGPIVPAGRTSSTEVALSVNPSASTSTSSSEAPKALPVSSDRAVPSLEQFDAPPFKRKKKSITWSAILTHVREYELWEGEREEKSRIGNPSFTAMGAREHQMEKETAAKVRHPQASVAWPHLRLIEFQNDVEPGSESDEKRTQAQFLIEHPALKADEFLDSPREPLQPLPPRSYPPVIPLADTSQMYQPGTILEDKDTLPAPAPASFGSGFDDIMNMLQQKPSMAAPQGMPAASQAQSYAGAAAFQAPGAQMQISYAPSNSYMPPAQPPYTSFPAYGQAQSRGPDTRFYGSAAPAAPAGPAPGSSGGLLPAYNRGEQDRSYDGGQRRYGHEPDRGRSRPFEGGNGYRRPRICDFYNTPRGCTHGSACRFEHVST